jgi:hypothetical protein
MNAVETIIKNETLNAVKNYSNVINILTPGVDKYFKNKYNSLYQILRTWEFIREGEFIKIHYSEQYLDGRMKHWAEIVPLETIVKIAVALSMNK